VESSSPSAATMPPATPARPPPTSRLARRKHMTSARIPPARAMTSHRSGAASPNGANSVVNRTGSGFQEGPVFVSSSNCVMSRPHWIQAHGS
jgi:hypothetical protein